MLPDNLSSNILRPVLYHALSLKLEILKLDSFLQRYSAGQTIPGKVTQVLPEQKAVVEVQGGKLLLQFPRPVLLGQRIAIEIEQIHPVPVLKLAGVSIAGQKVVSNPSGKAAVSSNTQSPDTTTLQHRSVDSISKIPGPEQPAVPGGNKQQATLDIKTTGSISLNELKQLGLESGQKVKAEVLRGVDRETLLVKLKGNTVTLKQVDAQKLQSGESVTLRVRSISPGKYVVDVKPIPSPSVQRPLDLSVLKNYLPVRQPLVQVLAGLKEVFLDGPSSLLKEFNIDPGPLKQLQANLQKIVIRRSRVPDAPHLKELVDRTGFHYEAKVKDFANEPSAHNKNVLLENDLKGQLMRLARQLEQIPAGPKDSGATDKFIARLMTQVNQAVSNIELQQLTHHFSKEEQHPLLLQLPENLLGEKDRFKIYILPDRREDSNRSPDSDIQNFNLIFLLNLSALGDLKIETRILKDDIRIHITGSNSNALQFLQAHVPELEGTFQEWGYSMTVVSRHQPEVEMEIPDSLGALLIDTPLNMVDIKT